jgi:DNA-binding transcriptional MerR regulator
MPDYFLAEQLAAKLGLPVNELADFEARGVIKHVEKSGRTFYSSRDFYRLKGVLHFMRNKGFSLDKARAQVEGAVRQVSATGR